MTHPTKTAALTHLGALCNANKPTTVLLHQAVASSAALFSTLAGEPVEIRIGSVLIARSEK
jgi:hypothetical protein